MNITTKLLGKKAYYIESYCDKQAYAICSFGKIDSITVSATDNTQYLTIIDNKGRKTNFAPPETIKSCNLNALDINQLQLIN